MLRFAFHFNNYSTLGHSIVTYSLVKLLKNFYKNNIQILVIEEGMRKTKLLHFDRYATLFYSPNGKKNLNRLANIKNSIIDTKNVLINFKPNFFLTEYFPFNRNSFQHKTFPALLWSLKRHFQTKIISSCTFLNCSGSTYNLVREFYDLIIFHLPEFFYNNYPTFSLKEDNAELKKIFEQFQSKIFFSGFIIDKINKPNSFSRKIIRKQLGLDNEQKLIIVSRGGRLECENLIIYSIFLARKNPNWFFVISTGPSTSKEYYRKLQKVSKDVANIKLSKIIYPDFDHYLRAADLSINMAGYNTVARLLCYNKKSIIFPINNTDQVLNARFVSKFIPCKILSEKYLKISVLEDNIRYLLKIKRKTDNKINQNWFNGLNNNIEIIRNVV